MLLASLSCGGVGLSTRAVMEGHRAKLDTTLLRMFPYIHKNIEEQDREALVRRGLLTREQLSRFSDKKKPAALTDISIVTRTMLSAGSWSYSAMEVIQQPFAPLQDDICEEDSWSTAKLGRPQTYERAESWPELSKEVLQLLEQLESLDGAVVFKFISLPSTLPIDKARRVNDVTAALATQLGGVDQVAQKADINSVIRAGGGQVSASRAALQVEQRAVARCKVTAANVSGVIEVVACDQLRVARGDSIQAILNDEHKLSAMQPAFQKAYAFSVEEEVAVFAVTDYKVAFFMSRSPDVTDKRIRISEPVWWDQANPPAKAYWLRFMQLAAQRHSEKAALARELVPFTGPGKRMPMTSDMAWLPLARLLKARYPSARFRTPLGLVLPTTSNGQIPLLGTSNADQQLHSASESDEELAFSYAFADLKHGDVICHGSHAQVKEGDLLGSRVILKLFRQDNKDTMAAFMAELNAYDDLKDLQGTYIPKLLLAGPVQETGDFALVLTHGGNSFEQLPSVGRKQGDAAVRALKALHGLGALHGDISLGNFVYDPIEKWAMAIDLQFVTFPASDDKKYTFGDPFKQEVAALEAELYTEESDKWSAPRKRHKGLNGQM